ncbi:uncharacterized protein METZ01_LOCUS4964 [marine metagenome]|uniref:Saccharopine dehydrogenase NADP binding domain-containing protein n=1 Tax=marine metagenome TaxID=408172 RepID=A0A381NBW8_9ZZZZ
MSKEFDIIIWGATGFTGRLVAEYIFKNYSPEKLNWAIAGRDKKKLINVRDKIADENIPIIIADSFDEMSLTKMTQKTKVICSTVGPYSKYGSLLVKSCIKTNTHYCDLAGEAQWIRKIVDTYHQEAKNKKIRIVNSCGFDSIPSDIGVYFIHKNLPDVNIKLDKISMRVSGFKGSLSGGTYASMNNIITEASKDRLIGKILTNPYGLNPEGQRSGPDKRDLNKVKYDEDSKSWIAPFMMAGINTKIVRRSNALSNYSYGKNFTYDESIMTGDGFRGRIKAIMSVLPLIFLSAKPGSLLKRIFNFFTPKPGQGPNENERENGYYSMRFYIRYNDKSRALVRVTGDRDPGYGSTSKMLAESAICLSKDSLKDTYGVITPSIAMGDQILDRLQAKAGLTFKFIES